MSDIRPEFEALTAERHYRQTLEKLLFAAQLVLSSGSAGGTLNARGVAGACRQALDWRTPAQHVAMVAELRAAREELEDEA